jgi:hypothetical protein
LSGHVLGHFGQAGQVDNWILDKVGLGTDVRFDSRIPFFKNEKDLEKLLVDAERTGKLPLMIQVHTGGGKLGEQVAAASGKPLGGEGGNFGGDHVLCVSKFNQFSKKLDVDNSWGLSRDLHNVTVADLYAMTRQPEELMKAEKQYKEDIAGAYADWCSRNSKTWGRDYPQTAAEGKNYFDQYRKAHGR